MTEKEHAIQWGNYIASAEVAENDDRDLKQAMIDLERELRREFPDTTETVFEAAVDAGLQAYDENPMREFKIPPE